MHVVVEHGTFASSFYDRYAHNRCFSHSRVWLMGLQVREVPCYSETICIQSGDSHCLSHRRIRLRKAPLPPIVSLSLVYLITGEQISFYISYTYLFSFVLVVKPW